MVPKFGNQRPPMAKCDRNLRISTGLYALPLDLLQYLVALLGLHGTNLRCTCKLFARMQLPEGAALALNVLQVGPSIPYKKHQPRRATRSTLETRWNYFSYRTSLVWRVEWALALKSIDIAPIRVLLDAYEALPYDDDNRYMRGNWIGCWDDFLASDSGVDWCHLDPTTKYTAQVRLVLFKAIESRMWDIIWGLDLDRSMEDEEVVAIVKRILNDTPVRNNRCFHFTRQGWLGYTPFLLAAEKHNEPLVRYLSKRADTDLRACSTGGNNAYAICKNALLRNGAPMREIASSRVLEYLRTQCWCDDRSYRPEGR